MNLENTKNELENNCRYYNENENYKSNIDFILNCLNDYDLIYSIDILKDKIIIKPKLNNNWYHLYIEKNYRSTFLIGVIFNEIVIYKDNYTILINGNILLDIKEILFNFYEKY